MPGFFDKLNASARKPIQNDSNYHNDRYRSTNATESIQSNPSNLFNLRSVDPNVKDTWDDDKTIEFGTHRWNSTNNHPELETPLINKVMNADSFVKSGADSMKKAVQPNQLGQPKRPKYMPPTKTGMELFDEETQIHMGPAFNKIFDEKNDCEISVTGGDGRCPIISTFKDCNFSEEVMSNIRLRKYMTPTQIQKCVMPLIKVTTHDMMGYAQTGSGKTAAFLLPIVDSIQAFKKRVNERQNSTYPYTLLVAPTKELAEQLGNDARAFCEHTDVRVAISYGDMPVQESINHIRFGCDIFVATCGRLVHFIREEIIKLDNLMFFVLDEADKLLNDTFLDCVRAVKQHKSMNLDHRTFMFSATFSSEIQDLAKEFLRESYYFVRIGEINSIVTTVDQTFIRIAKYDKQDCLIRMLREMAKEKRREDNSTYYEVEKTIVFVQHKRQSDRLAVALAQAGFLVISINADRTLKQRREAEERFTRNIYNVLVATDVAARGLNFPNLKHVVNYDLPENDQEVYIHRIGRAGRAGNLGRATSFFDPEGEETRYVGYYVHQLQRANQPVPEFMLKLYRSQMENEAELKRVYGNEFNGQSTWN